MLVTVATAATTEASAQQRHAHRQRVAFNNELIVCNERGCSDQIQSRSTSPSAARSRSRTHRVVAARSEHVTDANGNAVVVGRRPAGCPHNFCGCEASRYLFGVIRPELNLAANWMRKFPRAAPAPRMAAVRSHHVMVLMSHVSGNDWLVHDGNSGGGLTREHVRSIAGHVIVDPQGARAAARTQ